MRRSKGLPPLVKKSGEVSCKPEEIQSLFSMKAKEKRRRDEAEKEMRRRKAEIKDNWPMVNVKQQQSIGGGMNGENYYGFGRNTVAQPSNKGGLNASNYFGFGRNTANQPSSLNGTRKHAIGGGMNAENFYGFGKNTVTPQTLRMTAFTPNPNGFEMTSGPASGFGIGTFGRTTNNFRAFGGNNFINDTPNGGFLVNKGFGIGNSNEFSKENAFSELKPDPINVRFQRQTSNPFQVSFEKDQSQELKMSEESCQFSEAYDPKVLANVFVQKGGIDESAWKDLQTFKMQSNPFVYTTDKRNDDVKRNVENLIKDPSKHI